MRGKEISDRQLSQIVWMYYIEDMTQGDIAQKLLVSRPTILSYLKMAKERRLFEVRVQPEHFRLHQLSSRLKAMLNLPEVYIVDEPKKSGPEMLKAVCTAAAYVLAESVLPGDQIGVSWGETIRLVSQQMPLRKVNSVVVRQLIGSVANPIVDSAEACTLEIARKLSAQCVNLNAPAICSKAELATALRQEPIIAQQLDELSRCNKAILSLSPCDLSTHAYKLGVSPREAIIDYGTRGAVGIMVGRFMDARGAPVLGPLDDRLIGLPLIGLKNIKDIFLVVCGARKVAPALAAIRGGYISRLIIDLPSATKLLAAAQQPDSATLPGAKTVRPRATAD
jgi:deoxyribonucleoside regulator